MGWEAGHGRVSGDSGNLQDRGGDRDTDAFAGLFTEDATYEDSVYGTFTGHAELKRMLRDLFHQDATDFHWEASDLGCGGSVGYANYRWS